MKIRPMMFSKYQYDEQNIEMSHNIFSIIVILKYGTSGPKPT